MKILSHFAILLTTTASILNVGLGNAEDAKSQLSVHEIRAILNSIPPYLPGSEVSAEIDVFGSTSMDALAHGWASGFNKFHPKAKVVVSDEGSETVFDRLAKSPSSLGMLSRPVVEADLARLKQLGLKQPIAVMVAREGLGVFVNESNPIQSISHDQFTSLFCIANGDQKSTPMTWSAVGVEGDMGEEPVEVIARTPISGTQAFLKNFVFQGQTMREPAEAFDSNVEVVKELESTKNGVAICGLRCGGHSLRLVGLLNGDTTIPGDDHSVLMGRYPLIRPLTLVLDVGQDSDQARATREFVRYALHQAGQSQDILAGFFPFDPPTLLAEIAKLENSSAEAGN
ncbi:substrate-binding domain-containing protein [Novipirellula artificiosorum]|uniref:PBP superfamily domain protein n=1 Tax=Novipirellula artificiosorum TaxID=2528016 RepID=A0A5C6CYQ3_9BACT|nr:substrate-binding domain-containing protein [Novipirellula artificiosorum]TWU29045.1 PBP superfamily domain protein [Novipirellula artificiosorum]